MLDSEARANEGIDDSKTDDLDLISQMADMSINKEDKSDAKEIPILDLKNPVFEESRGSSKIRMVSTGINAASFLRKAPLLHFMRSRRNGTSSIVSFLLFHSQVVEELRKIREKNESSGTLEKAVVVSQWTSMLEIVRLHVEKQVGLKCAEINGMGFRAKYTAVWLFCIVHLPVTTVTGRKARTI